MHRSLHVPRFIAASIGLHLLVFAAAVYLTSHAARPVVVTPVNIVDLPRELLRKLPPLSRPAPPQAPERIVPQAPERPLPKGYVPDPSHLGSDDAVTLPKTSPSRRATGERAGDAVVEGPETGAFERGKTPLPFLSQADIDALARKGMPAKRPGDESVTLDTDEFKLISYNRWLKIKVESVLKYPELAAVSGIQGTLYIRFDILKDGSLGTFEVLKSSGYRILDAEAERAIRASAPFQPLPDDWDMERYSIRAAVLFYLSEAYVR